MKINKTYLFIAIVLILLAGIKIVYLSPSGKGGKGGKGSKNDKKPPSPVSVYVVTDASLNNYVIANGTVVANEQVELKTETNGRIVYLNIPEGKAVTKGTLLLKLASHDLQAQLDRIKAQLALAKQSEQRLQTLLKSSGISKQEYEQTLSQVKVLQADSAFQQAQIAKTEIRAPFDGILGIRNVSIGAIVSANVPIASIYQLSPVKIDFSLPEKYALLFQTNGEIECQQEGAASAFKAKITVKDPQADASTRSIRFRAVADNRSRKITLGAFVQVKLTVPSNKQSLFIPTEAIVPIARGKKVYVVKNNTAVEQIVETGLRTEDYVQVLSGVNAGDSVVTNGNFQLKDGSQVKVVQRNKKEETKK